MTHFDNQVAMVTGGARGVGAACAAFLARGGADVALVDLPEGAAPMRTDYPLATAEDMASAEATVTGVGGRVSVHGADVRRPGELNSAVRSVRDRLGHIDLAVLAAGIRGIAPIDRMDDDQWDAVIDANLHGVYNSFRALIPSMVEQGFGRIVVIVGEEARRGVAKASHSAAAGWATIGLAKSVALEVADAGVAVNVVALGPMDTPAHHSDEAHHLAGGPEGSRDGARHALEVRNPFSSAYVDAATVAETVGFLLSRSNPALTGGVTDISNGLAALNSA